MKPTQYIWKDGEMLPWEQSTTHVMTHSLHYGTGVFEGIRFYETDRGPAIFKLYDHIDRLFYSAETLGMDVPYDKETILNAVIETVAVNKLQNGYIRPIIYYGVGSMKIFPQVGTPLETAIACWPWGKYLRADVVDVKVSDYIRLHPKSTITDAKICGHYINSFLAGLAIRGTKFHEALLLDQEGYVTEGGAENVFIVKEGVLLTTQTGTIVEGITRNTIMEMAKELGIEVKETRFRPQEIIDADEALFCGTAAEIVPIRSLDEQLIGGGEPGPITQQIQAMYRRIIHGQHPGYFDALTWVEVDD